MSKWEPAINELVEVRRDCATCWRRAWVEDTKEAMEAIDGSTIYVVSGRDFRWHAALDDLRPRSAVERLGDLGR